MRFFEIIAAVLTTFLCLRGFKVKGYSHIDGVTAGIIMLAIVCHGFFEGLRWQMAGVYIGALVLGAMVLKDGMSQRRMHQSYRRKPSTTAGYISMMLMILIAITTSILFPVKDMVKPSGPYDVGTMSYDLIDGHREELYGEHPATNRKFRIQLWYPTEDITGLERIPWKEDGVIVPRGLMQSFKVPFFIMDHTTLNNSNSYKNAPLRAGSDPLPIVVMSHGWTGFRNLHSDIGELLASFGYMVIGVDHSYGSVGLVFEDGEEVWGDPEALPERGTNDDFDSYATALVHTYAEDSRYVLDHLEDLNTGRLTEETYDFGDSLLSETNDLFEDQLDLNRIGVFGHSTGGGGVVELSLTDNRVKAVVGMDPWVEPIGATMLEEGMSVPTMFFRSTQWTGGINDGFVKILATNEEYSPRIYEIQGSKHQDFTMIYLYGSATGLIGLTGELPGNESAAIQQDFIKQFFDTHLKGMTTDINVLVDQYETVDEVFHSVEK